MPLFLPFTDRGEETERAAIALKRRLGVGVYDPVDPFAVLTSVPARLLDFNRLPEEVRKELTDCDDDAWSAIGYGTSPDDGHELILLNPKHHEHRQRASLMEELVHIHLDHPKVTLAFNGKHWSRPYNDAIEDEAFNVGAACIIPYKPLFNAIRYRGATDEELAARFVVSRAYVRYRIKRAGLYGVYKKRSS